MEIIECLSCGANDFFEENGYIVCKYCGTKYRVSDDYLSSREAPKENFEEADEYYEEPDEDYTFTYFEDDIAAVEAHEDSNKSLPLISFIFLIFCFIVLFSFIDPAQNDGNTQNTRISENKAENTIAESMIFEDRRVQAQVEEFLSDKNAGFGSEHFYTDTPLLRLSKTDDEVYLGIVRIYNTSYHMEVTGNSADIQWAEYYTGIYVSPKKAGITLVEFTNDLNDYSFQVMIVVE